MPPETDLPMVRTNKAQITVHKLPAVPSPHTPDLCWALGSTGYVATLALPWPAYFRSSQSSDLFLVPALQILPLTSPCPPMHSLWDPTPPCSPCTPVESQPFPALQTL